MDNILSQLSYHLHPALSGAPLWFLSFGLICDAVAWTRQGEIASRLSIVGLIAFSVGAGMVIAAFLSGYLASETANAFFQVPDRLIGEHHRTGRLLLMVVIPTVGIRSIFQIATRGRRVLALGYLVLALVCVGLAGMTAFRGGELVFTHGAGVRSGVVRVPSSP